jgi:hypothetical protein
MCDLSISCAAAGPEKTGKYVRRLWTLLTIAPQDDVLAGTEMPSPVRFQALLAAEAFESAVLEMIGSDARLSISLHPDDHPVAAIVLPGLHEEKCPGANIPLAVAGALASALFHAACKPRLRIVRSDAASLVEVGGNLPRA